jgi:hypothetical protein
MIRKLLWALRGRREATWMLWPTTDEAGMPLDFPLFDWRIVHVEPLQHRLARLYLERDVPFRDRFRAAFARAPETAPDDEAHEGLRAPEAEPVGDYEVSVRPPLPRSTPRNPRLFT